MQEEAATGTRLQREPDRVAWHRVFGLSKKDLDALEVLGFLLFEQGRTHEAKAIFQGLIALDSERHTGFAGLGALALVEQEVADAVAWLREAVKRNPNDPTVRANLGEALLKEGKFEFAAAEFERALAMDPEQKDAGANRARAILAGMKVVVDELERSIPVPSQPESER